MTPQESRLRAAIAECDRLRPLAEAYATGADEHEDAWASYNLAAVRERREAAEAVIAATGMSDEVAALAAEAIEADRTERAADYRGLCEVVVEIQNERVDVLRRRRDGEPNWTELAMSPSQQSPGGFPWSRDVAEDPAMPDLPATPFDDLDTWAALRPQDIAERLRVDARSVRRAIASGALPGRPLCAAKEAAIEHRS